jgi:eukaryotic-like serine/threonine-protein kinase
MSSQLNNTERWKNCEGRTLDGRFPLRQWLGGSEHSAVFLTERSGENSQKAAIKLIAAGVADSGEQLQRWRAAAKLSDPHLMTIFEAGQSQIDGEPVLYVVSEYAEEDLSQILPQRPLTAAETSDLLPPVLDTIGYLHSQGYVHAAIKPSNLLAVGDDLKLSTDRIVPIGESKSTQTTRSVYDAPETESGKTSPAADLWSIGVTLVAALTQQPPAQRAGQEERAVPDAIPEPFRGIARMCLRRDPSSRATIAEIKAKLQPAPAPGRAISAPPASPSVLDPIPRSLTPTETAGSTASKWRFNVAVLCGVLIVVFLIGRKFFHSDETPAQSAAKVTDAAPEAATPTPQSAPTAPSPQASVEPATTQPAANQPVKAPPAKIPAKKSATNSEAQGDVVRRVLPDVPKSASRTISGTIKITVHVDVDSAGKVTSAKITHPGSSAYFAKLAMQAAEHWEFSPSSGAWNLRFQFKKSGVQAFSARAR